jgi:hypothetical protein
VDFLPSLALHSLYRLGTLEALTTPMHLRINVSDSILQLLYLLQLAMQLLLQLAVPMHFGAKAVVSEAGQRVVNPVLTPVVMVEDSHPLGRGRRGFLWHNAGRCMGRSSIDGGSWCNHAQGIGVVGHVDGDVLCLYFASVI